MQWPESIVMVTRVTCFTVIVTSPAWMFAVYFIFRTWPGCAPAWERMPPCRDSVAHSDSRRGRARPLIGGTELVGWGGCRGASEMFNGCSGNAKRNGQANTDAVHIVRRHRIDAGGPAGGGV